MQKIDSRPREANKKLYERSEFKVAFVFFKVTTTLAKKLPPNRA